MAFYQKTRNDILSSWGSSTIAVLACSPLEVIKMNAQVTSTQVTVRRMIHQIRVNHGAKGFYTGLLASLGGQPGYWTFYWPVYNYMKSKYSDENGNIDLHKKMPIVFASSVLASMTVNPLFVFKTRFQTDVLKRDAGVAKITYRQLFNNILLKEGIRGFYKGNFIAQIKNSQMMIQMPLYDFFNTTKLNPLEKSNIIVLDRSFVSGVFAKTIASCLVYYPIDTIRTNIRNNVENKSILQVIRDINTRPGGVLNYYRGVGIYWISAVPTFGFFMYMYEKLQTYFQIT